MAYVSIPKDLTAIKTKFVLGLTKRQAACFAGAALMGLPLFFLLKSFAPSSVASFVMVIVMLPWFMFAMYEKHGMPLEKYLHRVYLVMFKRPKIRTYQTQNYYAVTERQNLLYKEVESIVTTDQESAETNKNGDCKR